MSRTFLCVSLCILLCQITALTLDWTPCPAITDVPVKLNTFDYASAEQFHNLPKDTLRPTSNDTEFTSNIKKILIRSRFPTYGLGVQENEEPLLKYNVPNDLVSECSTTKVPYHNKAPSNIYLNYFAKRYRALNGQRKGAIYMLQGGPGAGGEALEPMALQLWSQMKGQYDIILPDHRGTARSTLLSCEPTNSYPTTVYQCQNKLSVGYSNNLDGFSADEAAMDTLSLMKAVKQAYGGLNYLYGVSYGTYVSHRIIQINPDAVDAVILDGVCGGKYCDFTRADLAFETTAKDFFAMCAKDDTCGSKLGRTQDAVAAQVKQFYAANNECTNMFIGVDKEDTLKKLFTAALMDPVMRLLIPAIIYRGKRCGVTDRIAIMIMINNYVMYQSSESARKMYPLSNALNFNIGVSELQGRFGNKQKMEAIVKGCHICNGASLVYPSLYNAGWKTYPESSYAYTYAKYNKPLLMLNGDLDPQTYYVAADAFAVELRQTAPLSRLIRFPNVVHYVLGRSPLASNLDDNCGLDIVVRFLNNPSSINSLDTSCTTKLLGLPFGGYSVTYDHVATDLYEGMGLNKAQLTTFILVVVFIVLAVLSCCVCCGVCCCYVSRVACFKKKPAGERGPLLVVTTGGTQPNTAPTYYTN